MAVLNDDEIIFLLIEKFAQAKGHQIASRFLPRKDKYEKALGSYLKSTEWDFCLKLSFRDFSVDLVDKHLWKNTTPAVERLCFGKHFK